MNALGSARWPDLTEPPVLAVPVGATEQHGPHLPLATDTTIAVALCEALAIRLTGIAVAPAVAYGSSGEHAGFPGTLSIGHEALTQLLVELVRSADHFAGVVLVNAHGGNRAAINAATRLLHYERRRVRTWHPQGSADDSHAGRTETSVMLHLRPAEVATAHAQPGNTEPLSTLMDSLRAGGVRAVSPNGVLGDPAGANAAEGERILGTWVRDLTRAVESWRSEKEGTTQTGVT